MTDLDHLRILLTNVGIGNRTGTEIVVLDLALELARVGHFPMIWAPLVDLEVAASVIASGIPVATRFEDLPHAPDIIHGHHHLETIAALRHFPEAPAIFVCHSGYWWHDAPPRHPRLKHYVAVDQFCRERLLATDWIDPDRVSMVLNAVDMRRHWPRTALPERARRALIFSNYAGPETHLDAVEAACRLKGLELSTVGSGVGSPTAAPEDVLPGYDLVFAKARCAIEAMASGCAVILCDTTGLGAMVTTTNVEHLRLWNFGFRVLQRPLDPRSIAEEIERYSADDAGQVSLFVRRNASLGAAAQRYLAIYRSALAEPPVAEDGTDWYPHTRPLDLADQAALTLECTSIAEVVLTNQHFVAEVALDNRSNAPLATAAPWPCLLTYRWRSAWSGAVVAQEGFRTLLQPPCWPGGSSAYSMRIIAPTEPGDYVLRLTLVQEGWRWLDALAPRVCADVAVSVIAAAASD